MNHRTPRPTAALGLGLALVFAFVLSGCGLFDTAQPEPPSSFGGLQPDFTLPESLVVTLERAIERKSASNYGLCFADSPAADQKGFHASFDPADIQDYVAGGQSPPADWVRQQELSFFDQFVGTLSGDPQVNLTVDSDRGGIIPIDATREIWNLHFRVFVGSIAATGSSIGLQIERVNLAGDWKITHWEDRRDTTGVPSYGTRRLNGR